MAQSLKEIAKMIDHSLLHPTMDDEQLVAECEVAKRYDTASVCIKPYAVPLAAELLEGTDVAVGTVIGFPHGSNHIQVKVDEAERACAEGATELDFVVNVGKVLSRDWNYIDQEVKAMVEVAHSNGAILKMIFENDFLDDDELKIKLCEMCNTHGVDFAKTSTGFGYVKQENGMYQYFGATDHDLKLMREHCDPEVEVKAAGKVRTLDDVLRVKDLGVTRIGATATEAILEEAKRRGFE